MNKGAARPHDWFTLKPGQSLWDTGTRQRTMRLANGFVGHLLGGRYRLGRLIDDAQLCGTYEAYELATRQPVAVELLTRPTGAGPAAGALLRREALRIAEARHPGLRVVRSIDVEEGVPFIVADPIVGESLRQRLARLGPMSIGESLSVALQVIDALHVAHAAGLVHANLKPEKIRLTGGPSTQVATVMGLGVTTLLGTMRDVDTRGVGTPPYLAPEQLTGFKTPAPLTDVWAVGLLLFEMVAGERAFNGTSSEEVGRQIAVEGPTKLRTLRPDVPMSFERIVGGALARRPEQRLSLDDLRRALRDLQSERAANGASAPPRDVIVDVSDPCDDVEATTDLHLFIETDLG